MNILIEGWRGINHSYSLVNQWQIKELKNKSNIFLMTFLLLARVGILKKMTVV